MSVKNDVFIHLVAEDENAGIPEDLRQGVKVRRVENRSARVVREVQNGQAGPWGDAPLEGAPIDAVRWIGQGGVYGPAAVQGDHGDVAVVGRLDDDDLVAGVNHGGNGCKQRLRGAGGDGDLRCRVIVRLVKPSDLFGDPFAQGHDALHRGVLVVAVPDVFGHEFLQIRVGVEFRKALGEVDGAASVRQIRHLGEYGQPDGRQLRSDGHVIDPRVDGFANRPTSALRFSALPHSAVP